MFSNCESLKNINLSNFDTKNVVDMNHMFSGCKSLKIINLANFITEIDTNVDYMFKGCKSLNKNNVITGDDIILNLLNDF